MLRVLGFFVLAALLASFLGHLPVIGPLFRYTGLLGILLSAALLSAAMTAIGSRLVSGRKLRAEVLALGEVGGARNHGKIGSAYLARGRARAALPHLEEAVSGEPEVAEWHYRLACARADVGDPARALEALAHCLAIDEEHAYGAAQMRKAQCLALLDRPVEVLEALATFERNHGPSPEAAYRRGRALRALGRKDEAQAALREVSELARQATRYQRREAGLWSLRASLARIF